MCATTRSTSLSYHMNIKFNGMKIARNRLRTTSRKPNPYFNVTALQSNHPGSLPIKYDSIGLSRNSNPINSATAHTKTDNTKLRAKAFQISTLKPGMTDKIFLPVKNEPSALTLTNFSLGIFSIYSVNSYEQMVQLQIMGEIYNCSARGKKKKPTEYFSRL